MKKLLLASLLLVACNRESGTGTGPRKGDEDMTTSVTAAADLGPSACVDPNDCPADLGVDLTKPANDLATAVDMAQAPDLSPVADLSQPADMTPPADDDGCLCDDWVNHGQGKNHCLWYQHDSVSPANGHGNGLCKYNCQ